MGKSSTLLTFPVSRTVLDSISTCKSRSQDRSREDEKAGRAWSGASTGRLVGGRCKSRRWCRYHESIRSGSVDSIWVSKFHKNSLLTGERFRQNPFLLGTRPLFHQDRGRQVYNRTDPRRPVPTGWRGILSFRPTCSSEGVRRRPRLIVGVGE